MAELDALFYDKNGVYSGDELGLPYRDIMGAGVVEAGDLLVTALTGWNVSAADGAVWIAGEDNADAQPTYRCRNAGAKTVTIAVADATNPRKDLIIGYVEDQTFAGDERKFVIDKVTGTPAASPVEPSVFPSANYEILALIDVPAGAASIAACTITDRRNKAQVGGGLADVAGGGWSSWG